MPERTLRSIRGLAASAALAALAMAAPPGCAKRPVPSIDAEGLETFKLSTRASFVPDLSAARAELEEDEEFRPPAPRGENRLPYYPVDALSAGCSDGRIVLRIIIDALGDVIEVSDSPLLDSTGGSCGAEFRASSAAAVRAWRFWPAEKRRLAPGEDYDGDGEPDFSRVVDVTKLPVYLDIRFDFEVVGGEGRVQPSAPIPLDIPSSPSRRP